MKIPKIFSALLKWRKWVLALFDMCCLLFVALIYNFAIHGGRLVEWAANFIRDSLVLLFCVFFCNILWGVYQSVWRYTDTASYMKLVTADGLGGVLALVIVKTMDHSASIWFFVSVAAFTALVALTSRFVYRLLYKKSNQTSGHNDLHKIPVAIVGAGQIGALLADELLCNPKSNYKPMFFIDRDKAKVGSRVAGLKVYPESDGLLDFIEKQSISEIFIALSGLDNDTATHLFDFYRKTSCKIKIYDSSVRDISENTPKRRQIREFQIEDLLFRKTMSLNNTETAAYYQNKVVLVTGGGGSIGSELCRQIATCHPKKLIIVDIYENNAYDIQQELIRNYGEALDLAVEIASVRDRERLDCIFQTYRPEIVFHAAAHKHVPLMEHSRCEAIKNNVVGTFNTADMAEKYGVKKFILISTDKAVNPTNIMGASKRMCEMIIQCRTDSRTSFAAVRFGNVLGSNGSVIPLFKQQIAAGGPVTITDKRIIRYFMTIPEASQLVMEAGAMAKRGELFVLDMGKPVKIYDLAVNMIHLSGLELGKDIQIEEIGLRPGEKLYEELLMKSETLDKTENQKIFIEKDTPLSRRAVDEKLQILWDAVEASKGELASALIQKAFAQTVPTFHSPESVNRNACNAEEMKAVGITTGEPS